MKCDSYSCQGESHIVSGKPCQDWSLHWSDDQSGQYIAIVCDGHGGERYFRSDQGAKFLCEITKNALVVFAESVKECNKTLKIPLFGDRPFTQVSTVLESNESVPRHLDEDVRVVQLLSSIVTQWREQVEQHALENPITVWEKEHVRPEYLVDFEEGRNIERNYGCTLMAYLQTDIFWLAIHLGDGKCIMFDAQDNCFEPVLWDEKCFLNRTTSICDPNPVDEFRYSYCGDGSFPVAVFLGSDGIDDSYGDGEGLHNFYLNILRMLSSDGAEVVHSELEKSLPIISKKGSKDDMSIAFVYDDKVLQGHTESLTRKQIERIDQELSELKYKADAKKNTMNELVGEYERKRASLRRGDTGSSEYFGCEKLRINLKYAFSDYTTFLSQFEYLKKQILQLYSFLGDAHIKAYALTGNDPDYFTRIKSCIDGSYGKKCDKDEEVETSDYLGDNTNPIDNGQEKTESDSAPSEVQEE